MKSDLQKHKVEMTLALIKMQGIGWLFLAIVGPTNMTDGKEKISNLSPTLDWVKVKALNLVIIFCDDLGPGPVAMNDIILQQISHFDHCL